MPSLRTTSSLLPVTRAALAASCGSQGASAAGAARRSRMRFRSADLPVEEAPPLGGRALDEEEILGGEEDGVERADELLLADGLAVEADLPPPAAREEELEAALRRKTRKGQLQRAGLLSEADEIPILMRAVGAPERRVADGL